MEARVRVGPWKSRGTPWHRASSPLCGAPSRFRAGSGLTVMACHLRAEFCRWRRRPSNLRFRSDPGWGRLPVWLQDSLQREVCHARARPRGDRALARASCESRSDMSRLAGAARRAGGRERHGEAMPGAQSAARTPHSTALKGRSRARSRQRDSLADTCKHARLTAFQS